MSQEETNMRFLLLKIARRKYETHLEKRREKGLLVWFVNYAILRYFRCPYFVISKDSMETVVDFLSVRWNMIDFHIPMRILKRYLVILFESEPSKCGYIITHKTFKRTHCQRLVQKNPDRPKILLLIKNL